MFHYAGTSGWTQPSVAESSNVIELRSEEIESDIKFVYFESFRLMKLTHPMQEN
jgi:hypothetical protein